MKSPLLAVLILTSVSITCCGARSTPASLATAVAGTVIAQVTATSQVMALHTSVAATVMADVAARATAAQTPSPTAKPTQSPTATRILPPTPDAQIEIPTSWQTYQDPQGKYSFRYPDTWQLVEVAETRLAFQSSAFGFVMLSVLGNSLPYENEDLIDVVDQMAATKLNLPFERSTKGKWPGTVNGAYIEGIIADPQTHQPGQMLVLYARTQGHDVLALVAGMTVDSVERFSLDRLIASMRYGDSVPHE